MYTERRFNGRLFFYDGIERYGWHFLQRFIVAVYPLAARSLFCSAFFHRYLSQALPSLF